MKNKPKTRSVIVLDKSGSMYKIKEQAVTGYNEQVQQMKEDSKEQDILVSLLTFDADIYEHLWDKQASELAESSAEDYAPNGGTAYRDALWYVINRLKETAGPDDENTAYLVTIISDGESLNDKHIKTPKQIAELRNLIDSCQKTGRWTFNYMGCSEENLKEIAKETNIPLSNMSAWSNVSAEHVNFAMSENRGKLKKFFSERGTGKMSSMNYASDVDNVSADYSQPNLPISNNKLVDLKSPENITGSITEVPVVPPAKVIPKTNVFANSVSSRTYSGWDKIPQD